MSSIDDSILCLKGCGKLVNNSSGICTPCRKTKCKGCDRSFSPKIPGQVKCEQCRESMNKRAGRLGIV